MKLEGFLTDEEYAQETALPLAFEKVAIEYITVPMGSANRLEPPY